MRLSYSFSVFNFLLAFDLLTTYYGIRYFGCVELNPLPFEYALTLRFILFLIFHYFKKDFVFHSFFVFVIINNVLNILLPYNNIFLYVLSAYIGLNTFLLILRQHDGHKRTR